MTVTSGFFNSVNHDRLYDAEQLSSIFDGVILDGVYQGFGDSFDIVAYSEANDTVIVKTGRAWFDHTWTLNDSEFSITLDPPNVTYDRIDAIVLDINRNKDTRENTIKYIKGEYGYTTDPVKPTLVKEELHSQYPLAYINVIHGVSAPISNSNIDIKVGSEECPLVTGILEVMNSDMFIRKMETEFYDWFNGLKDLDDNQAFVLQNQIDELEQKLEDTQALGIQPEKYEFAQNCTIQEIWKSSDASRSAGFILPDGYLFVVGVGAAGSLTTSISPTYKDIWYSLINQDGTFSTSKLGTRQYTNIANGENRDGGIYNLVVLCRVSADSYPVQAMFALADVESESSDSSTSAKYGLRVANVTISEEHSVSVNFVNQNFNDTSSNISPFVQWGSVSEIPGYMSDGSSIVGLLLRRADIESYNNTIKSYVHMFKISSEGAISLYTSKSNKITIGVPNSGDSRIHKLFIACNKDETRFYVRGFPNQTTTNNNYRNYIMTDPGLNPITISSNDNIPSIPYNTIYGNNDTYVFIDSSKYCKCVNSYTFDQEVKSVPPTISLIMELQGGSSATLGFNGGAISSDKSIMSVLSSSNKLMASLLGDTGLNIWSAPGDVELSKFDGISDTLLPNSVKRYTQLKHPYLSWSNSSGTKWLFYIDGNFGVDTNSAAGRFPVVAQASDYMDKHLFLIEKG